MKNVELKQDGDILTIKIDLSKNFGGSKSGKSTVVASTEGNKRVASVDGKEVFLCVNAYMK